MKKSILILLSLSAPLFANQLTTFNEITDHLTKGREISVVVQDKLCTMHDLNTPKIPVSTMVMKPDAVIFTDKILGFDGVKFSAAKYYYAFPNGILQRASFGMNDSGQANILIAFFDAETNRKSADVKDVTIQCQLGEGVTVYGR